MLIWFAVMSILFTWAVFQSPALDYRLVALGGVLPVLEVPFGVGPMHSVAFPTAVLVVVMAVTRGRRLVRRRWLGLPIGLYLHLVLDLAWTDSEVFWWPVTGTAFGGSQVFETGRGWWSLMMEIVAIVMGVWAYRRFGLDDADRRDRFLRTGQLDRSLSGRRDGGGTRGARS